MDEVVYTRQFIGGAWVEPAHTEVLQVVSPASEQVIGRVPLATADDIARAADAARRAFDTGPWPRMAMDDRRAIIRRAGELLAARADELDRLATAQNGLAITKRQGTVKPFFDYIVGLDVQEIERRDAPNGDTALVVQEPVGVVAAIVPWNGPVALSLNKILPALLAGCTVVLKSAPETPLTDYALAEAFDAAGLPEGALNVLVADRAVSELLVREPRVDCVSFTGSTEAGRRIGAICGSEIKRCFLELGGKSPVIVLDDADMSEAAKAVLDSGMFLNNGQACVAWTRILVPDHRHDEMVDAFCDVVDDATVGDPFDPATTLGPLVASRQRQRVEGYINIARQEGARVARGGHRPRGLPTGWYVEPTLLVDATNQMRSSREEIFGPVASVIRYKDVPDAVRIANDTNYGLAAGVYTSDEARGVAVAGQVRAGIVGINNLGLNVAFPMGGFKQSGIGRQYGPEGLREYLEVKSVGLPRPAAASLS